MEELENLYQEYDRIRNVMPLFAAAKYGFTWQPENGCIFYPDNYLARSRSELLARINPDILSIICSENDGELTTASRKLPNALFILCGERDWAEQEIPKIVQFLKGESARRIITHRQLGDFLPYGDKSTRWFDVIRKSLLPAVPKVRPKVFKAFNLFKDTLSRATFLAILRRYLFSSDALVPYIKMTEQYFSPLYRHRNDEIFIDCGGFIGDTLEQYLEIKANAEFGEYILFEPDDENFSWLQQFIQKLPPDINKKITAHKLGVSRESEELKLMGGEGSNSYIGNDGNVTIKCIAMDEFLADKKPSFIKMDLQGHEAFALHGAKLIISSCEPVLAISVYHFVQDLWELPLLIQHFNPGYKFFLRAYRPEEEYICYAIPPHRCI